MATRRDFIKIAAAAGLGALLPGCSRHPKSGFAFNLAPIDRELNETERAAEHLLNRLSYGPRPGDMERAIEKGFDDFIEEQLYPESIDDLQTEWLVRRIESLKLQAPDIFELPAEEAIGDLRRAMMLRAVYSERRLLEVMVEFWSDHFNIFAGKGDCAWLKIIDDRETIRPNALGKFRDLLKASALSPAMLVYLDGTANIAGKPNENYAREIMELHTLGVDGGYAQEDVMELSRALTGWKVKNHFWRGRARFDEAAHDKERKIVLGQIIEAGDESDLERAVEIVCNHPSTSRFISRKLCRRFVSDEPSDLLIEQAANRFRESGGDIRAVLREIFHSEDFRNAPPKFKRPYRYAISALRLSGANTDGGEGIQEQLRAMGQLPFDWPTPDGYPEDEGYWSATLLARWNFAFELSAGRIKGTSIEGDESSALLFCEPEFQYH